MDELYGLDSWHKKQLKELSVYDKLEFADAIRSSVIHILKIMAAEHFTEYAISCHFDEGDDNPHKHIFIEIIADKRRILLLKGDIDRYVYMNGSFDKIMAEFGHLDSNGLVPDEIVIDLIYNRFNPITGATLPKPCPVCGSNKVIVNDQPDGEGGYDYSVLCECLLTRGVHKTRRSAIKDWNDRPRMSSIIRWMKSHYKKEIKNVH